MIRLEIGLKIRHRHGGVMTEAMFTLYRIMKRSVAEAVQDRAAVYTRNTSFGTISVPEQDCFAPFLKDVIPAT